MNRKTFASVDPTAKGGWIWSVKDCSRVLYRLPELLKYPDACVFVCEGEKDADRVASLDHCATTVACGDWTDDCVKALAGRDVLVLEDNDETGRKKVLEAAQALHGTAKTVRIVRLPDLPDKGDVSDWLDADQRNASKFADVCFGAPLWAPVEKPKGKLALSSAEFVRAQSVMTEILTGLASLAMILVVGAVFGRLHGASDPKAAIGDRVMCGLLALPLIALAVRLAFPESSFFWALLGPAPVLIYTLLLATTEKSGKSPYFTRNLLIAVGAVYVVMGTYAAVSSR